MNEELKKQAKAIGQENKLEANTASRIGEILSNIENEMSKITEISHDSIKNSNEFLNDCLDEINGLTIPEGSIVQKLKTTLANKTAIKQAIQNKGVDMSDSPQLTDYGERIRNIQSEAKWSPNSTWWDIKSIVQDQNNQEYTYKTIQLLLVTDITTIFTGGVAYKTSDGEYYTAPNVTHTWNPNRDKQCTENGLDTYKTRWVITYHNSSDINMSYISKTCIYLIMDGVLPTTARFGNTSEYATQKSMLISFDMINGANFKNISNFSFMFGFCYLLRSIPLIDTSNGTNFNGMFAWCHSLTSIPFINTSNGTNFEDMFVGCFAFNTIPPLNTSNGSDFSGMFSSCMRITSIPSLDTSNGYDFHDMFSGCQMLRSVPHFNTSEGTRFNYMFESCTSLKTVPNLDLSKNQDSSSNLFDYCYLLEDIKITNPPYGDLNLSYSELLSRESLLFLINNLSTNTSLKEIILGATNLAKLTTAEKAIATNKGWILT